MKPPALALSLTLLLAPPAFCQGNDQSQPGPGGVPLQAQPALQAPAPSRAPQQSWAAGYPSQAAPNVSGYSQPGMSGAPGYPGQTGMPEAAGFPAWQQSMPGMHGAGGYPGQAGLPGVSFSQPLQAPGVTFSQPAQAPGVTFSRPPSARQAAGVTFSKQMPVDPALQTGAVGDPNSQPGRTHTIQTDSNGPPGMLKATVEATGVTGGTDETDLGGKLQGQADATNPNFMHGETSSTRRPPLTARIEADPDRADPQLMLEWDKWRNHFAHKVWQKYCEKLNGAGTMMFGSVPFKLIATPGYQFPDGLWATYTCAITSDKQMAWARITTPSGNPQLDAIILGAVKSMQGSKSLEFPKGSQRKYVMERESLGTGSIDWHERKYGDTEHVSQTKQPQP